MGFLLLDFSILYFDLDIALSLQEFDKIFHIFSLYKTYKFSIFRHSHERITFSDIEHISNIFWYNYLSFCSDCNRPMHLYTHLCSAIFFLASEHIYEKLEK